MSDQFQPYLNIVSGLHNGSNKKLLADLTVIGSSFEADIILKDQSVSSKHASIELLGGEVDIVALADDVEIENVGTLQSGDACTIALPVRVKIGTAAFSVTDGPETTPLKVEWSEVHKASTDMAVLQPRPRKSWRPAIAVSVLTVVFLTISGVQGVDGGAQGSAGKAGVSSLWPLDGILSQAIEKSSFFNFLEVAQGTVVNAFDNSTPQEDTRMAGHSDSDVGQNGIAQNKFSGNSDLITSASLGSSSNSSTSTAVGNVSTAMMELKAQIELVKLRGIALKETPGAVVASGAVWKEDYPRWRDVQRWFDQRYGDSLSLVSKTVQRADKRDSSPPSIEAIMRGQQPHIIMNGEKYMEGRLLSKGWKLVRIEENKVILEYEKNLVEVKY